jgi:hypothetical protein
MSVSHKVNSIKTGVKAVISLSGITKDTENLEIFTNFLMSLIQWNPSFKTAPNSGSKGGVVSHQEFRFVQK